MSPMKPTRPGLDVDIAGSLSLAHLAQRWEMTEKELRSKLFTGRVNFMQIKGRFRVAKEEIERIETEFGRPPRFP